MIRLHARYACCTFVYEPTEFLELTDETTEVCPLKLSEAEMLREFPQSPQRLKVMDARSAREKPRGD
jgi:hypothetical protein